MSDRPIITDLEKWLAVATRRICIEASRRIEEEISDHYQNTLEEELQLGQLESVAHASAMKLLGDPQKANKEFLKTELTVFEAKYTERMKDFGPMKRFFSIVVFVLFYPLMMLSKINREGINTDDLTFFTICLLVLLSSLWIYTFGSRKYYQNERYKTAFQVDFYSLTLAVTSNMLIFLFVLLVPESRIFAYILLGSIAIPIGFSLFYQMQDNSKESVD